MRTIGKLDRIGPGQERYRWTLVGARTPGEVDDNVAMCEHPVPDELWAELAGEGAVRP